MKYRNIKTGFIFETDSECTGEGWELVSSSPKKAEPKKAEPKEEEPVEVEPIEEEPKPKRNTKGKTK